MNNEENNASPEALARDAEVHRERIGDTLGQLEGRLSPDRMVDNAVGLFKEHGGDIADSLQRSVKSNPLPVILTGVGIAWMMMSQRDSQQNTQQRSSGGHGEYPAFRQPTYDTRHFSSDAGSSDSSLSDKLDGVKASMSETKGSVSESLAGARDSVGSSFRSGREGARQRYQEMQDGASDLSADAQQRMAEYRQSAGQMADEWSGEASRFMREQPLVAGALGIALGALLGGVLPTSDKERQLARRAVNSDAGQRAVQQASDKAEKTHQEASRQIDNAADIAEQKVDKVRKEATTDV